MLSRLHWNGQWDVAQALDIYSCIIGLPEMNMVLGCFFIYQNDVFPCHHQRPLRILPSATGERGGSVVECRTPEREVVGSKPTAAVLCP